MICDSKRVAYARLQPEDLLYSICEGERGINNGVVQTLFLQVCYLFFIIYLSKIFIY